MYKRRAKAQAPQTATEVRSVGFALVSQLNLKSLLLHAKVVYHHRRLMIGFAEARGECPLERAALAYSCQRREIRSVRRSRHWIAALDRGTYHVDDSWLAHHRPV
jgi:hypothetical protein